jgi:hypothetical protein
MKYSSEASKISEFFVFPGTTEHPIVTIIFSKVVAHLLSITKTILSRINAIVFKAIR